MKVPVSDDLWAVIEALVAKQRGSRKGGRPPVPNRAALTGILFVLQTGIPWAGRACRRRWAAAAA